MQVPQIMLSFNLQLQKFDYCLFFNPAYGLRQLHVILLLNFMIELSKKFQKNYQLSAFKIISEKTATPSWSLQLS